MILIEKPSITSLEGESFELDTDIKVRDKVWINTHNPITGLLWTVQYTVFYEMMIE